MKEGFRQTMAWVHTWIGLVCGWLLCAIFLTGSISVFRDAITQWMTARPVLEAVHVDVGANASINEKKGEQRHITELAVQHLQHAAPDARFWRIELPKHPADAMLLAWRSGEGRGINHQAVMHPATGEILPAPWGRKTEGGRHFMLFHYMLHGDMIGFWIVGFVSMCALVTLVSGVVVHRRIFADFFTFRPGKGQRSWLDAHNATAVLTLPFLFMIVYTGVAFFYSTYMPQPLQAAYGTTQAHARFQKELKPEATAPARPRTGTPADLLPLEPLLQQAEALTGRPARMVMVDQPGDRHMTVRVFGKSDTADAAAQTVLNPPSIVSFDGVNGEVLNVQRAQPPDKFSSDQVHDMIKALHVVHFGGWSMKWLYFVSGLLGTAMIAMGGILFMVKRRRKSEQEFGQATPAFYRFVEAMNVASLAGIGIASVAYLYANRLIPAAMEGRELWEIRAFLIVCGLALVHAWIRPALRAWVEQFALASALCIGLPLLNFFTTGQHVVSYATRGDAQSAWVELTTLLLGVLLAYLAWRVHCKQYGKQHSKQHHKPRAAP
ncbi:PepSY domain-containing protein [Diaphorobacter sp. HDW4B]|uniref:PepSY-associated TM helix domain-containing protein n=1 Tax=Diaphorobacter sp. HDW4B TaxID=2714925 RepID=UPI001408D8AC|nr:PepSY-associated TM helix domain-containing protein [Diaphorobacter sp. HDW4B]QIL71787.1 PepSY domain-containing protein [Diaphorobacter sp. HDW4B]